MIPTPITSKRPRPPSLPYLPFRRRRIFWLTVLLSVALFCFLAPSSFWERAHPSLGLYSSKPDADADVPKIISKNNFKYFRQ